MTETKLQSQAIGDGEITAAKIAEATILQIQIATSTTSEAINGYDGGNHPENYLELTFTPESSTSTVYIFMSANGLDSGGAGRMTAYLKHSTSSGVTNGTEVGKVYHSADTTGTDGLGGSTLVESISFGDTSTHYIAIVAEKNDNGNTGYIGRYNTQSSILAVEIED